MQTSVVSARSPFWWVRWVPAALLVLTLLALLLVVGSPVLLPLLISLALAIALEPLVDWFERRRWSRGLSVLMAMLTATGLVLVVLLFLLPSVWHQLQTSIQKAPEAIRAASAWLQNVVDYAKTHLSSSMLDRIQAAIAGVRDDPSRIVETVQQWLQQGVFGLVNLASAAIGLLIVPFFVYYLLLDMRQIRSGLDQRIPERYRDSSARLFDQIADVVRGYVRGRFLVALGMSAIYATGLWILGIPLWAGIGLIAGLIGIIPYLGVMSGLVLALAFAILNGAGIGKLIGVVVVFIIAQLVEDYVLTPRLIGDRLELHPMLVFIALIVAGDLFGLLGLVLAIPVLAVCKVVVRFVDELYQHSDFYLGPNVHHVETSAVLVREAVDAMTPRTSPAEKVGDAAAGPASSD